RHCTCRDLIAASSAPWSASALPWVRSCLKSGIFESLAGRVRGETPRHQKPISEMTGDGRGSTGRPVGCWHNGSDTLRLYSRRETPWGQNTCPSFRLRHCCYCFCRGTRKVGRRPNQLCDRHLTTGRYWFRNWDMPVLLTA